MALSNRYQHPRGTRAALNTLASANGLKAGEIYLITDESRIAVALTTSTYQTFTKSSEAAGITGSVTIVINGGGSAITAGQTADLPDFPFPATITGWTITGDVSGSAVVTISRATYANFPTFTAISGTEKPTLASAQKNQDLSLTTWTTALAQGDVLRASVDSATTVKVLYITIRFTRT